MRIRNTSSREKPGNYNFSDAIGIGSEQQERTPFAKKAFSNLGFKKDSSIVAQSQGLDKPISDTRSCNSKNTKGSPQDTDLQK